eukprot:gene10476-2998_t
MDDLLSNNDSRQESQLSELTTWLCIGDENYIRNFDIYGFVPVFLAIMGKSGYSGLKPVKKREIKVLAARAVGLVLDIVPHSCEQVISFGAIEVLINLLKENDYDIELAEEVLKCLEKIAVESPKKLLEQKDFMKILTDSIQTLKKLSPNLIKPALSLISNLCRKLSSNDYKSISSSIPILSSLFQGSEEEVLIICDCFAYLLNHFSENEKTIKDIASQGLIENIVDRLIRASTSKASIIKLLSLLCTVSPNVSILLCQKGVIKTIQGTLSPQYQVFNGEESLKSLISSETMLNDILFLLNNLLPKIHGNDIATISSKPSFEWFWEDDFHNLNPYQAHIVTTLENAFQQKTQSLDIMKNKYTVNLITMKQYNKSSQVMRNVHRLPIPSNYIRDLKYTIEPTKKNSKNFKIPKKSIYPSISVSELREDFMKDKQVTKQLLKYLMNPLIEICSTSLNLSIRQDCVMAMTKILILSNEENLIQFLDANQMTSFLCKIISSTNYIDFVIISHILLMADILLNISKTPYQDKLIKEEFFQKIMSLKSNSEYSSLIQLFLSKNQNTKKLESKNERILKEYVQMFDKKQSFDFSKLLELFENDNFSCSQFYKSNFSKSFFGYLKSSNDILNQFSKSIHKNPKAFQNLVHMINFTLESKEQLEAVTSDIFEYPPSLMSLSKTLTVNLTNSNDGKKHTLLVEPLSNISLFSEYLEKTHKKKVEIYYKDVKLEPSMMLLEFIGKHTLFDFQDENYQPFKNKFSKKFKPNYNDDDYSPNYDEEFENDLIQNEGGLFGDSNDIDSPFSGFDFKGSNKKGIKKKTAKTPSYEPKKPSNSIFSQVFDFTFQFKQEEDFLKNIEENNDFDKIPGIDNSHPSNQLFSLLRILNFVNENPVEKNSSFGIEYPIIDPSNFISNQISSKIRFQLQTKESLLLCCFGKYPLWIDGLMENCKFLFPFELRRLLFYSINFGTSKILNLDYNASGYSNEKESRIGRSNIQKETIDRSKLFEQSIDVLDKYSLDKSTIEIEYENERGIGLGPTLNFYNSISHDIQKKKFGVFHDDDKNNESEHVLASHGLFPSFTLNKDSLKYWKFIGRLVGKSLEDNRLLDLQFNNVFLKIILGKEFQISDVEFIDKFLYNHITLISNLNEQIKSKKNIKELNEKISSLYLDFSFEGVELIKNGSNIDVTFDNFEKYFNTFIDFIKSSINKQIESFLNGLKDIVPLNRLKYFSENELNQLICGNDEKWDMNILIENTLVNGYKHDSKTIQFLFEILIEMNEQERRQFLEFVTGSNRLPIGGIKHLNPKLSIIKLVSTKKDEVLPTSNTCFHYLKLSEYSSKKVLKERLFTSMKYGQGFQLT